MNKLEENIKYEIDRLSADHDKNTINLINLTLKPMLQYIKDHEDIMKELRRIGGKHAL